MARTFFSSTRTAPSGPSYTPEDWAADPALFRKVLHPDDHDRVLGELKRIKQTGEPLDPPAELPLQVYSVVIDGDVVALEVPEGPIPVNE